MNDDILLVSGGGSTAVSTDDLLAERAALEILRHRCVEWRGELGRIQSMASGQSAVPAPAWTSESPDYALFAATRAVDQVAATSGELAGALGSAAESYGDAERAVEQLTRLAGSGVAALLGYLTPVLALLAVPMVTSAVAAWFWASVISGTSMSALATAIGRDPRVLTNPALVALVRVLVSSVDDAAGGLMRVPAPVIHLLGDDGFGVMGVSTSAASVLFAARQAGTMNETAVTVAPVGRSRSVSAPDGVRGLAERIPHAQEGEPQVRIERYGSADAPQWIVYIGGTIDWSPESTSEPWDLTSNIVAVAEQQSGSYRAVLEAMELAGIGPDDPVAEVGHSQGGLVAAQIAASEKFNTVAVLTFGAPAGQVAVPAAVPMLAVAHTDDLVPALGGTARDSTAQGNAHLLVRREVYADTPIPDDVPLPAHRMTTYADTAALIDESNEPRIVAFTAGIAALAAAGTAAGTYAPASVALGGGAVGAPAGAAAGAPVGAAPGSAPAGAVGAAVGAAAGASGAGATGAQAPASAAPAAGSVTFWRGTRTAPTK